jgi:hypothetical protein
VIGAKVFYGAKPMVPFEATTPARDRADGRFRQQ